MFTKLFLKLNPEMDLHSYWSDSESYSVLMFFDKFISPRNISDYTLMISCLGMSCLEIRFQTTTFIIF